MISELLLPELGENITSGVIVKILVSVGEKIEAGQPVVEIETDKAVVEVPADISGVVTAIYVAEGEEIQVAIHYAGAPCAGATSPTNYPTS